MQLDAETAKLDHSGLCPKCGCSWNAGDVLETFKTMRSEGREWYKDKTDAELIKIAGNYGWTPESPKNFSRLIGIEERGVYDGVCKWRCPDCNAEWNRFSKESAGGRTRIVRRF
jgi:hypothetical protein